VDDTLLRKSGTTIEGVSMLWDDVNMRSVMGFRMLLLGYFDGMSFLPINFTLHREIGQRPSNAYFTKSDEEPISPEYY